MSLWNKKGNYIPNFLLDLKVSCCYVLLNNKFQLSYEIVLGLIKNIITENNSYEIKLLIITTVFEKGLINTVKLVFKNIRTVGCLFHYVKNIRLNMQKLSLFKKII